MEDRSGESQSEQAPDPARVATATGLVEGMLDGAVGCFLGIPFARPPIGELRWCPPEPVEPWEGVRSARAFGNPPMQYVDAIPVIHERKPTPSEDCLYLNVWRPARRSATGLPVMVWFHGGAFVVGSGSAAEFDGRRLAMAGVVVVTVNYRLGPFGFFAHPALAAQSPTGSTGNYGLLDQRAALQWVQENIAAFGGDPANVTIFGESAGGISVSCHVASPQSQGLFAKAISQSATWFTIPHGIPDAHTAPDLAAADAERLARRLGCGKEGRIIDDLRSVSAQDLLEATAGHPLFAPVVDGWFLPEDPASLFAAGRVRQVPYLLGWNADEGSRFAEGGRGGEAALDFARRAAVDPVLAVARAMGSPVYLYNFNRVPSTDLASQFGAYHGLEVPYVFGNLPAAEGYDSSDERLSATMIAYWTQFAATGDPNAEGLAPWPRYTVESGACLELV